MGSALKTPCTASSHRACVEVMGWGGVRVQPLSRPTHTLRTRAPGHSECTAGFRRPI